MKRPRDHKSSTVSQASQICYGSAIKLDGTTVQSHRESHNLPLHPLPKCREPQIASPNGVEARASNKSLLDLHQFEPNFTNCWRWSMKLADPARSFAPAPISLNGTLKQIPNLSLVLVSPQTNASLARSLRAEDQVQGHKYLLSYHDGICCSSGVAIISTCDSGCRRVPSGFVPFHTLGNSGFTIDSLAVLGTVWGQS